MLFPQGQRPDADRLAEAVEEAGRLSITHRILDPLETSTDEDAEYANGTVTGYELLRDGMTYDLSGLSPGPAVSIPPARHRYGFAEDHEQFEALSLAPGPHLEAGAHSIPVVRTQAGIAASLSRVLPGLKGFAWPAARTVIGAEFFVSSVTRWLDGGPFPSLGFTAFSVDSQGGMVSEGLAWFTGQELRFSNDIAKDRPGAVRLGVRLVNQVISQGRVTAQEHIIAPDGSRLALEPTRDGKTIRVRRA